MNNKILEFAIFVVGFSLVFGSISFLLNLIEDGLFREKPQKYKKTGRKIVISDELTLHEAVNVDDETKTVHLTR